MDQRRTTPTPQTTNKRPTERTNERTNKRTIQQRQQQREDGNEFEHERHSAGEGDSERYREKETEVLSHRGRPPHRVYSGVRRRRVTSPSPRQQLLQATPYIYRAEERRKRHTERRLMDNADPAHTPVYRQCTTSESPVHQPHLVGPVHPCVVLPTPIRILPTLPSQPVSIDMLGIQRCPRAIDKHRIA